MASKKTYLSGTVRKATAAAVDTLKRASGKASYNAKTVNDQLKFNTDEGSIADSLNKATEDAYAVKQREANLGLNKAEDTSFANTQNALAGLKGTMATSQMSGANRGAVGANALQALLGLGQQNNATVTSALQGIQGIAGEKAAAMSQNAATALDKAQAAKQALADAVNAKYASDQTYAGTMGTTYGNLAGVRDTNATQYQMNADTNKTNNDISKRTQKYKYTYINK